MSRVLLIEPDKILAKVYTEILSANEYEVDIATGAQSAIMAADENTPDIVVLEIQLTEHSGIEFLYEFRSYSEWQNIPVIIQSHVPPSEFTQSWQLLKGELGVRAYLYKPQTNLRQLLNNLSEVSKVTA
jgi:DNA-binding response OmpR family regulator